MITLFILVVLLTIVVVYLGLQIRNLKQVSDITDVEFQHYVEYTNNRLAEFEHTLCSCKLDSELLNYVSKDIEDYGKRIEALEKTPAQFESKYSEETKKNCIEYYLDNKDNLSIRQAARDMSVPYSTLKAWISKVK